ncbi:helix-turn-helix domain-containing protein [Saccharibacillus sacchari]|uniref:Helix-turn-helix domain-containing protein n=1 Tax=Saccharibacillus sacchari TaxID=456493 RepID=A0ACC6PI95_9BACL
MIQSIDRQAFLQKLWFEIEAVGKSPTLPEQADGQPLRQHLLIYVAKGEGEVAMDGQAHPIGKNMLLIYSPGTTVELKLQRQTRLYWITFDSFALNEGHSDERRFSKTGEFPAEGAFRIGGEDALPMMEELVARVAEHGQTRRFATQQLLHDLLSMLLRHAEMQAGDDSLGRIRLTVDYMQLHYRSAIRVAALAKWGDFHPAYFSQVFKQYMDKTPTVYLTHLRMNKAKELLLPAERPIAQVAEQVGYDDEFYFSRRFKDTHGYAPSAYSSEKNRIIVSLSAPYTEHLTVLGVPLAAAQVHEATALPDVPRLTLPKHEVEPWRVSRSLFLGIRPDLILCKNNVEKNARRHINDIAPIISIPWSDRDVFRHLHDIANIVDRQAEATRWLEAHEQQVHGWREKVREAIGPATVAVCLCDGERLRMYGARNFGHVLYRALELTPPEPIRREMSRFPSGTGFTWMSLTPEGIARHAADILFVAIASPKDRERVEYWMQTHPAWINHKAVRSGKVFFVDANQWKIYAPMGIEKQLEEAGRLLSSIPAHVQI